MRRSSSQSRCHMRNAPLLGYHSSRITSAALCSYRSYNSAARLRCSFEYLAMMTTPPAQGVQHSVTTPKPKKIPDENRNTNLTKNKFRIPAGKVYLSPVVDCYDGMPVAWTIGTSPNAELANRMLCDACSTLGDGEHPIIHSDRGCHYRWPGWIRICGEHKLTRSMSAKGCSPDNAAAEGFFGRLKQESSPRARLRRRHHQGVHRTTGRIHDLVPGREDQTHFRHQHRQTKT